MFREAGAAVAVDGARKAWYFSSGVLVLALAVALGLFCIYMLVSLGADLLAVRRDLMSFPKSAWLAIVLKLPIALASFWLARKFALQTHRLWNAASVPMESLGPDAVEIAAGLERARQTGGLRLGVAAKAATEAARRERPMPDLPAAVPVSPAKRMVELKECLDAGVISSAEYETKRAEILRNL